MSELKKCKQCKDAGELSNEDIPKWSRQSGNYSPYPPFLTCEEKYNLEDSKGLVEITPDIGENGMELKLNFGKKMSEAWVFYWAPNESKDPLEILDAKEAYHEYENHGLKKTNKKGEVTLSVNLPQPYKEEKKTYCRHVHYLVEDKKEKMWSEMKTTRVIFHCSIEDLDRAIKEKDVLIINALPEEYFKKEKIPNSVNLVYKSLDKLSLKDKKKKIDDFVKESLSEVPAIKKKVDGKKLVLQDIPIITYCAHSKCTASEQLIDHLFECGYHNVSEWLEGIEGWNKERSFFGTEGTDDAEEDAEGKDDEEEEKDDEEKDAENAEDDSEGTKEDEEEDAEGTDEEDEEDEEEEDEEDEEDDAEGTDEEDDAEGTDEEDEPDEEDEEDEEEGTDEEKYFMKDGIKYFYDEDNYVYNEDLEHVGEVIYVDDKPVDIEWLDETKKAEHNKMAKKIKSEEDDEEDDEEEDEDDEEDEEDDAEGTDEEEEDDVEEETKKYEEKDLSRLMNQELRDLIKKLEGRDEETYSYEIDKTKDKLIDLIMNCQGVPTDKKDKKDYYKRYQLENMSKARIKKIAEKLSKRKGNSYKYQVSTWTKKKLIDLILNCQGDKKEMKGGWSFNF